MKRRVDCVSSKIGIISDIKDVIDISTLLTSRLTEEEQEFFKFLETNFKGENNENNDLWQMDLTESEILLDNKKLEKNQEENKEKGEDEIKNKKREFKCDFSDCKKIYKSKENLKLHKKNIHEKIKPYSCGFCTGSFSHRNGKTYHERKFHFNYLPYKCVHEGKFLFLV